MRDEQRLENHHRLTKKQLRELMPDLADREDLDYWDLDTIALARAFGSAEEEEVGKMVGMGIRRNE